MHTAAQADDDAYSNHPRVILKTAHGLTRSEESHVTPAGGGAVILPTAAEPRALCVALHDVAPATWPACRRLLAMLDEIGPLPVTLLVVPDYHRRGQVDHDPAFIRAIEARLARGDEVVLHGYHHLDDAPRGAALHWLQRRVYTAGEGEFAALAEVEAQVRLARGWEMLVGELDWPVSGFVAPAWLLSAGTRAALAQMPFRYTTTLRAVHHLPDWRAVAAPTLVYSVRNAWRRAVSRQWNRWLFAQVRSDAALLRLGLHPADAYYPEVVDDWARLLRHALEQRRPTTKAAWVEGRCGDATPPC